MYRLQQLTSNINELGSELVNESSQPSMPVFSSDWPADCPPDHADLCNGTYFHILQENPPGVHDLMSFAEKGRKLRTTPACPCMPYGLSVFTDSDDAAFMQRAMPRLGKFVALLQLIMSDGRVMLTLGQRPTHNTWWPSSNCVRRNCIAKVESVSDVR